MRFRNSLRLLMENFGNVYKMLLYKLAVTIIFAALSAALVVPRLVTILESAQWLEFVEYLKSFFKAVTSGDTQYLANFQQEFTGENGAVQNLLAFLKDMLPSLVWAMMGVVFFYLLKRVADTLCHYTVGGMLNDRMSAYTETPFSGSFVKNLGKAFTYALVYVPLMFLYNVAMISLCYFLFFYLLKRVADTLCHYTVGGMLNDRMSAYTETPFSGSFVKNLGKAFTYALVYVPLMFLYNVAMISLCYFLFFYLLRLLSSQLLLSLFLTITFIVLAESLKMTLTGFWLPAMTTGGEKIGSAMKIRGRISSPQFGKIFSVYVVSVYLILFVNVLGAISTIGSMLLLTIPASYYLLICVQYVNYYTVTGRRYFLAYDRVFADPSCGDAAHYLDAVGAAEIAEAGNGKAEKTEAAETENGKAETSDAAEQNDSAAEISAENVSAKNAEISPADKKEGNGAE